MDPQQLLAAYDAQLRLDAETPSATSVTVEGPLRLATFAGGRGFITYRDLGGADRGEVRRLVGVALEHYRKDPGIVRVEWKARGHDLAPGLEEALLDHGFEAEETESIMIGKTESLAQNVVLPPEVRLRSITERDDVLAMCETDGEVFDDPDYLDFANALLARLTRESALDQYDRMELWIAEAGDEIVGAGPVRG